MTEAEWWSCTDPDLMLAFLEGKTGERKLRLFACACGRLVWHLLIDERSRVAVEAAERFSDGLLAVSETEAAFASAVAATFAVQHNSPDASSDTFLRLRRQHQPDKLWRAAFMAAFAAGSGVGDVEGHVRGAEANLVDGLTRSQLLRDIFGPLPFRSVSLDPACLTPAVVSLARTIYDDRAFDHLPILGDALEEAGCDSKDILGHCRGPGPHVRGCWLLDLILGRG